VLNFADDHSTASDDRSLRGGEGADLRNRMPATGRCSTRTTRRVLEHALWGAAARVLFSLEGRARDGFVVDCG